MTFTFWQLVLQSDGSYVAAPYITLYDDMIEVVSYANRVLDDPVRHRAGR